MRDTLSNKLGSFQATLAVANKDENKPIWFNKTPLAFTKGLAAAQTAVAGLIKAGADQSAPTTGSTDALRDLRKTFETTLHPMARATFRCLKNLNRLEDAVKVDLTPSDLHNARAQALAGLGETVLELAEPLSATSDKNQPAVGDDFGVTAAKVAALDGLWDRYSTAVGAPRGARAKRKAITDALPSPFGDVEEQFAALDDMIVQFRGTPEGDRFVDSWSNARRVVDLGRRANKPNPAPAPPAPGTQP